MGRAGEIKSHSDSALEWPHVKTIFKYYLAERFNEFVAGFALTGANSFAGERLI